MEKSGQKFEPVIGLEVHVQLNTKSKIFCMDPVMYGAEPNTLVSPVSLAHPGTLPVLNKEVVNKAIKLGLAMNCNIARRMYFDRKNYFYPDSPKGYQLTQDKTPICKDGGVKLLVGGNEIFISLDKIHMEEDAGKSIHVDGADYSQIDLNRAGTPLLEVVTNPCMSNPEEVAAFLNYLRRLVRYLDISDANMEEGSLRCDANVSIKPVGSEKLGNKVEIKNMNSVRNVQKAIKSEIKRQEKLILSGENIISETRLYDLDKDQTRSMRTKEALNDYRYFPEPDISEVELSEEYIKDIQRQMPVLPEEKEKEFINKYGISESNASIICEDRELVELYESLINEGAEPKSASNWLVGPIKGFINQSDSKVKLKNLNPVFLSSLIEISEAGKVNQHIATKEILPEVILNGNDPVKLAKDKGLLIEKNADELNLWVTEAISNYPDKVKAWKNGKKGLSKFFMGEVMKASKGKADPKQTLTIIEEQLNNL
ncbi:Asp-tRNA(Asn)/Glu-tRNA(Gln) amidotransferase subunit GatB [Marinigracilibium pacificum]|uniref:Aspartyl/glutamyl-tRNA(Asn/Gln) amidotransferase subunit B n=1 Tax=Marinigracilibium pacificum TaxID=2729599 RepID=A0A848J839_9BACT|nr:Asp-tRNA(Asn)/Glu-tRNA(Gln) amidotransferase subunit GatB [Marinigracilibium pacificum]NMM49242.1 Asp-tRNA(Asn)/Glu-tRNA(Gln) amidotransferase subunit GatB [Marinigracilibium pacificum]